MKKHETLKLCMDSCLKFSAFGKVNIATQLDESYRIAVHRHNDEEEHGRSVVLLLSAGQSPAAGQSLTKARPIDWAGGSLVWKREMQFSVIRGWPLEGAPSFASLNRSNSSCASILQQEREEENRGEQTEELKSIQLLQSALFSLRPVPEGETVDLSARVMMTVPRREPGAFSRICSSFSG
ncbi:hypothetical protein MHYP_G00189170 [Metynnis hypsauchen]